ncbi:MAG: hypothetical protein HOK65_12635 [Crocinitomicaceae bacterium]|jgi:hypothetical protein|nr:hypothetical protein [Crocinitomicaceae bacterium]
MKLIKLSGIVICSLLATSACKSKKPAVAADEALSTEPIVANIQMKETMLLPKPIDFVNINNLSITGDILEIDATFSGCEKHDFTLYGNRAYQKSLPPKIGLALIHDAHGDKCRKQSTKKLYFNIKDIRYPTKQEDYVIVVYVNQNSGKSADYKY